MSAVTDRSAAVVGGASSAMYSLDHARLVIGAVTDLRPSAPLRTVPGSRPGPLPIAPEPDSARYRPNARCGGHDRPFAIEESYLTRGSAPVINGCVARPPRIRECSDDATL